MNDRNKVSIIQKIATCDAGRFMEKDFDKYETLRGMRFTDQDILDFIQFSLPSNILFNCKNSEKEEKLEV